MSKPKLNQQFGDRIRELRIARGLSQEDLGELCDLDRTYISSLERGHRNVSLNNIAALAIALQIKLSDLFQEFALDEELNP